VGFPHRLDVYQAEHWWLLLAADGAHPNHEGSANSNLRKKFEQISGDSRESIEIPLGKMMVHSQDDLESGLGTEARPNKIYCDVEVRVDSVTREHNYQASPTGTRSVEVGIGRRVAG
jgi:hypothetical protein